MLLKLCFPFSFKFNQTVIGLTKLVSLCLNQTIVVAFYELAKEQLYLVSVAVSLSSATTGQFSIE